MQRRHVTQTIGKLRVCFCKQNMKQLLQKTVGLQQNIFDESVEKILNGMKQNISHGWVEHIHCGLAVIVWSLDTCANLIQSIFHSNCHSRQILCIISIRVVLIPKQHSTPYPLEYSSNDHVKLIHKGGFKNQTIISCTIH